MVFVEQDEESLLVKQAVRRLSELDVSGIPPSQADFARLVEEVLQEEVIPNRKISAKRANRCQSDGSPWCSL